MPEWAWSLYPWMHLVGRIMFCTVFVMIGLMQLTKSEGAPGAGRVWSLVTGVMMLAGGVLVVLGWHRFIGAGLLAVFLTLSAFTMHTFWNIDGEREKRQEMVQFFATIALAGAALLVAYWSGGVWPMSLGG